MEIILTGSTGRIGSAVLEQCLASPQITSIVAFSRRALPQAVQNPQLSVIIIDDFLSYPDAALDAIKRADGCIWSLGTYNWDKVAEVEYPEVFQKALARVLDGKKTFRYVYLGGAFTEHDQTRSLWFLSKGRHIRGLAETNLLRFGKENPAAKVSIVKPAGITGNNIVGKVIGNVSSLTVRIDTLAAVMVELVVNGGEELVLNKMIVEKGALLSKKAAGTA
ncbi:NAD(P)-binding Rossmann-fold containing protein [Glarea lozoyensis ATCC 20868]|uniref:NAD(P)-binding Rossmann-fold containing protein n=1 Tax=Glarea lozoyensis (strain ATCC 20868 / MF5171) TaxID=1116229 RepID=S3E002_GLAL2|nr:NAD(P)-binding Rossmann-fold containing protein [Glarea lozoyensis ATCC 20868]EPE31878.1 NAD(P)-binding Rossmann-fold containing protein [Glarea lozoyensis ATCC 20868]